MGVESEQTSVRARLRAVLQELDVAAVCIDQIRGAVCAEERARTPAAALSLYRAWARAETTISSFAQLPGGDAGERFARDALGASYRAGASAVADALTR